MSDNIINRVNVNNKPGIALIKNKTRLEMMKRCVFCFYMAIICALLFSFPAYAVNATEYELEELGLTVSIPSDYVVFTRSISDDDPNLSAYGLTKDGLSSLMTERNIFLNGWDKEINQEIIVTMIGSSLVDFNLFSDMELTTLASTFEDGYKNAGLTVIKTEIYNHAQAKFLKIYISQPNGSDTVYGLQYYTVYDNKAINITMQSYSGKISSSQEAILKKIVDSAHFDTEPQVPNSDFIPTSAFTYTDPKTKSTFTVPENWEETPLSEERETIDVKFMSQIDEGMCIMYGNIDIWNELSEDDRYGLERADIDNSFFTNSDLADVLRLSTDDIRQVTYGTNEYFIATVKGASDVYGVNFTVSITHAILVNDGYMYWFQFSGTSNDKLYSDYETLLSSLTFPNQVNKSSNTSNTNDSNANSDISSQFTIVMFLLDLLVTIVVYSIPIIIYRYAIKKAPVPNKQAKRITIIYGICAFVVMAVLIIIVGGNGAPGGAILLWSWVNYRVLVGGKDKSITHPEPVIEEQSAELECDLEPIESVEQIPNTGASQSTQNVCTSCGAVIPKESKFCHKCGTKIL
ncbi:MAG TPA: zinc ribbon domain-containing protein [Clostridiaceae bacterium]|nr:zinc ribbon domain-containing protein [Clostridiaceae bacterium]